MKIMAMTGRGHEDIAEWSETTTVQELSRIDAEFNEFMKKGYSGFLVESGFRVNSFSPEIKEDIFLIAPVVGG